MPKFYFTFGVNRPLGEYYHVIDQETYGEARAEQVEHFGDKWAFQYTEEEWNKGGISQAKKYGLKRIKEETNDSSF